MVWREGEVMRIEKMNKLNRKIIKGLDKASKLDKASLIEEMQSISSHLNYFGRLKSEAEYKKDLAEANIKIMKGRVDRNIRKKSAKKPAENELKSRVECHPQVVEAIYKFAEAKYVFNILLTGVTAILRKGEQLSNIGHMVRKEMDLSNMSYGDNKLNKNLKSLKNKRRRKKNG